MGSNKFLIIALAIVSALALSLVGVSAAELNEADTLEEVAPFDNLPLVREEVDDIRALAEETFGVVGETYPAEPLLEFSYYRYSFSYAATPSFSGSRLTHVTSVSIYDGDGVYIWGRSFSDYPTGSVSLYRAGWTLYWGEGPDERYIIASGQGSTSDFVIEFLSSDSTQSTTDGSVNGTPVNTDMVTDIGTSVFTLGDALISFVVSSWVVMLPLAAWLVVLCIGAIRKLVKGV